MQVQRFKVPVRGLERSLPLVRYGHGGDPWIYVPTSGGDETEFRRYELDRVLRPWIESGRIQVVTFDAHGPRTLFSDELTPAERIAGYERFERALRDELIPWLLAACGRDRLDFIGASYGAFVAANLWLKRPEVVRRLAFLGGVFDMDHRFDGEIDDNVYFHTPLHFLPNLDDEAVLAPVRATSSVDLFAAADDEWLTDTHRLADVLRDKDIPFELDEWGAPHGHHESTWRMQLDKLMRRVYPVEASASAAR